jgi:branched-chain amino acid transport system substrate-binding protein
MNSKTNWRKNALMLAGMALAASSAMAAQQGVSKDELVLGSIQDLSGPIAGFGKQIRQGMQLRVDEANELGGVNGRKITLKFEDSGYDPKKAVLAAQKLVNQDKIFAMLGHIGTATNMAAMPVQFSKNVINFFPVTAARQMYEPFHRLKYSYAVPYYEQMRIATPMLAKEKNAAKVCAMYQDDDFGTEVLEGAKDGLADVGRKLDVVTSYKRGATDFASQMQKMASEKCDMVVMGTLIRETIGGIATARRLGFNPVFLGSSGAYTDLIHKLGGKAMDGLYATMSVQNPYLDDASQPIRFWAQKYKTQFNDDPTVFSVYGYSLVDSFLLAAEKAGANLTTDNFIKAMDTMTIPPDIFGSAEMTFGPKKRLGSHATRLSVLEGARWKVVSEYMELKK